MEERLDDAINVLRSHCEPQLNMPIGSMETNNGHASFVNVAPPSSTQATSVSVAAGAQQPHDSSIPDIPVKQERPSAPPASEFAEICSKIHLINDLNRLLEKRKEPPDSDTKPSSSVEGSATKANGKRQRR